ncbi:HpcH/HpaI aldolase/citrate lyase family protein [Cognatishimia sp. MH4019]|uniref:HpcH/HpaI aldolase family protein n=1 Tax=Cognatishimia sp. MH4019 TaxID=2854030 RepID=UPI001CD6C787|nr:aldolase/citrate lyase family protein [Cognatishimia sp. MH4019]
MSFTTFRSRMLSGENLAGTFMKTPSHDVLEVLALSGLDFVCLDAEHSAFDRTALDACMAVARALDFPVLVRVASGTPEAVLQALDMGAVGVVVPHVDSVEKAEAVAKSARFGLGGRGFAGSTRWAGYATRTMPEVLAKSREETVVIAQIEEPAGVDAAREIAAVDGVDGLFLGPADLSVSYGHEGQDNADLVAGFKAVGAATAAAGKAYISWVTSVAQAKERAAYGLSVFFIGSEHAWMLAGAKAAAQGIHEMND